ncbi:beta-soluble NSF attachment protein, partial [Cricetulus griseus]
MDTSGKQAEAMALLAEAERKVKNSQSFFSGLFGLVSTGLRGPDRRGGPGWGDPAHDEPEYEGGSSKIEEACEMYARAANMFKMAKNWS